MKKLITKKKLIVAVVLALIGVGFVVFKDHNTNTPTETASINYVHAQKPEEAEGLATIEPCVKWVSTNPAPKDTVCVLDSFKGFETNSDVLVWSYNLKDWDKPIGYGDANTKTVLIAGSKEFGSYYPIYVKCPWGCSFGLIEVSENK